jgi:hypothetical protein
MVFGEIDTIIEADNIIRPANPEFVRVTMSPIHAERFANPYGKMKMRGPTVFTLPNLRNFLASIDMVAFVNQISVIMKIDGRDYLPIIIPSMVNDKPVTVFWYPVIAHYYPIGSYDYRVPNRTKDINSIMNLRPPASAGCKPRPIFGDYC